MDSYVIIAKSFIRHRGKSYQCEEEINLDVVFVFISLIKSVAYSKNQPTDKQSMHKCTLNVRNPKDTENVHHCQDNLMTVNVSLPPSNDEVPSHHGAI